MNNGNLDNIVLALLFSADEPISLRKMASVLAAEETSEIKKAVERWQQRFDGESWSIAVEKVAGGFQLSSRAEYAAYIGRLYSGRRKLRLSKAALETLAIIAYKQPITRAEIEVIRGVGCGSVLSNLMERELVRITGKAKVLGAPFLYGTTQEFLEYLGLNSLKDLPSLEELETLLEREEAAAAGEDAGDAVQDGESPAGDADDFGGEQHDEFDEDAGEEKVAESGSARLGPHIEEPYHRPLGDPQEDPLLSYARLRRPKGDDETAPAEEATPQDPDEDADLDEDPSHEPTE